MPTTEQVLDVLDVLSWWNFVAMGWKSPFFPTIFGKDVFPNTEQAKLSKFIGPSSSLHRDEI